ncbi:MAG: hypothetical protein KAG97_08630 [Victivallales bacterium]|nr:hypothetical protein [Victivallales bacterium]
MERKHYIFNLDRIFSILDAPKPAEFPGALEIASVSTDSRSVLDKALFIALEGDRFDGHDYLHQAVASDAAALCVSAKFAESAGDGAIPGSVPVIVVQDTLKAYQLLARERRRSIPGLRVVGVTGSCGKTSVKEITAAILSHIHGADAVLSTVSNTNNHVGVPLNLLRLEDNHSLAVIEMGSNHSGEIAVLAGIAESDIAIVTSIASAHLEFFRDLRGVAKEKSAILKSVSPDHSAPAAVIPDNSPSNPVLRAAAGPLAYTFGTAETADLKVKYLGGNLRGSKIRLFLDSKPFTREIRLPLRGRVQALNAAASSLAAILAESPISKKFRKRPPLKVLAKEFDAEKLADALESCEISGMRMRVEEINGVTWINDAYNANPDSVREALEWLAEFADPQNSRIALGDMLELGADALRHHSEILELAFLLLPGAKILAVGANMTRAADAAPSLKKGEILTYPDSKSAQWDVSANLAPGELVFLKGSRGMRMERLMPDAVETA